MRLPKPDPADAQDGPADAQDAGVFGCDCLSQVQLMLMMPGTSCALA